jgi:hypothetical protein
VSAAFELGLALGIGISAPMVAVFLVYLLGLRERWWR